jgi:hypothetical protein
VASTNVSPVRGVRFGHMTTVGYTAIVGDFWVPGPARGYFSKKAEARAAAKRFATDALLGSYQPVVISLHGLVSLVYRTPNGWQYTSPRNTGEFLVNSDRFGMGPYVSKQEAAEHARHDLAQQAFRPDMSDDELRSLVAFGGRDIGHWVAWQRAYSRLRSLGHDDAYAHQHAEELLAQFTVQP